MFRKLFGLGSTKPEFTNLTPAEQIMQLPKSERLHALFLQSDNLDSPCALESLDQSCQDALTEKYGVMAWCDKLVTAESLTKFANDCRIQPGSATLALNALFTENGYTLLKEGHVTLNQLFRVTDLMNFNSIVSDGAVYAFRHGKTSMEDVLRMKDGQEVRDFFNSIGKIYAEQIAAEKNPKVAEAVVLNKGPGR
jgi:hypothetical protein